MKLSYKKSDCKLIYSDKKMFAEFDSFESYFVVDHSKFPEEVVIAYIDLGIAEYGPNLSEEMHFVNKSFIILRSVEYITDHYSFTLPVNFDHSIICPYLMNTIFMGGNNIENPIGTVDLNFKAKEYYWCLFEDSYIRKEKWLNSSKYFELNSKDFNNVDDFWNLLKKNI